MSKPNNNLQPNRKSFIEWFSKKSDIRTSDKARLSETDPFLQKAKQGMDYFDDKEDLGDFLNDMDAEIERRSGESANVSRKKTAKVIPMWRWFAAAVSVAALLLFLFFWQNRPIDNQQLFSQYFEPFPNAVVDIRRDNPNATNELTQAFVYYEKGDYEKANLAFEKLLNDKMGEYAGRSDLYFYNGIALLKRGRGEAAETQLLKVAASEKKEILEAQQWYLALAALQQGNMDYVKKNLQKIVASDSFFKRKAAKLLSEVE